MRLFSVFNVPGVAARFFLLLQLAMGPRVFLHFLLSVCVSPSLRVSLGVDILVDQQISTGLGLCTNESANTNSVNCPDLNAAIDFAISLDENISSSSIINISLPEGSHSISTQTNFGARRVSIQGLEGTVTLTCDYYADNETKNPAEIHTWFFNQSGSVDLINLNFVRCGFPLRFFAARRVHISFCSFM